MKDGAPCWGCRGWRGQPVGQGRVEGRGGVRIRARTEAIRWARASGGRGGGTVTPEQGAQMPVVWARGSGSPHVPHSARDEEVDGSLGGGNFRTKRSARRARALYITGG